MRMAIKLLGIALVAWLLTIAAFAQVEFSAEPLRQDHLRSEPVEVKFTLTNASERDVLVGSNFALNHFVELMIEGPNATAQWCGRISGGADPSRPEKSKAYSILRPGASINRVLNIACSGSNKFGYDMNNPGRYKITALYRMPVPLTAFKKVRHSVVVPRGPIYAKTFWVTVN